MRSKIVAVTAACLWGLASTPALSVGAEAAGSKENPRDKVVCKTRPQTGSRLRAKTCHTVGQWETIAEEMRRTAQEMNGPAIEIRRN